MARLYPGEAYVSVEGIRHKALTDQIAKAAKERLRERMGSVGPDDLRAIAGAIKVQLGL